jgi:transcriptional regulator with XRE-family HTH domain
VATDVLAAVGRRVRELRTDAGLSQEALAERANLHRNSIGNIERGERDIHMTAVAQLCRALGVTLADFFAPFRKR